MVEPAAAAIRLGPYLLGERLGLGGMAEVYVGQRAGPHGFAKKFAIKRILPELAKDSRFVAMFVDEARICAALQHPNIVQVVDFGESQGELFMAMEFVDGVSVAKLLRNIAGKRERFPDSIGLIIVRDVLRGLSYAHEATNEHGQPLGLVHRDVSPGNVLVSRAGEVKLADFGIVRSAIVDRRTNPGELKGKLGYMSPEQVIGAEVDPRSDLFAVGILLAEMLITCPLFAGKNELEVLTRIHEADLTTFEKHGAHVPPELAAIVRKSLAREPRSRFQSARDFAGAIDSYAESKRIPLDHGELSLWVSGLGVLPSRSGTHVAHANAAPNSLRNPNANSAPNSHPNASANANANLSASATATADSQLGAPRPPAASIDTGADREATTRAVLPAPQREIRRPTPPALSLDDGRAAGRVDLLELVATGRVRRRTKLVGRDGIGRPAVEVPGTAELLRRAAFQFGDPGVADALWSVPIQARTLPARLYNLVASKPTGMLVARAGSREKRAFFVEGDLRFVSSTSRDELLGHRLRRRNAVDEVLLKPALDTRARCALHLGEILIGLGAIGPTALLRELIDQIEERFIELLTWREGSLLYFPDIKSGEEEIRSETAAPALITRGVRETYSADELAMLLGPIARALVVRGEARGLDPVRLGTSEAERALLERAISAGTLERLVAAAGQEGLGSVEETLRAAFIGLSASVIAAPSSGWSTG
jgi:serine/threonine-protein kinase